MKKEEASEDSSIRSMSGIVYKVSHKLSEFVARFRRAKDDSWGLVVFENGIVKEREIWANKI